MARARVAATPRPVLIRIYALVTRMVEMPSFVAVNQRP